MIALTALLACFGEDMIVRTQAPSPDGKFVATVWVESGGGAAGWCVSRLAVTPKSVTFDPAHRVPEDAIVAQGRCADLQPITWTSNVDLLVHYETALSKERTAVLDNEVRVTYRSP